MKTKEGFKSDSLTPLQKESLKSALISFKSTQVTYHEAYKEQNKTLHADACQDILKQSFSLAFVLSKFQEKDPLINLEQDIQEADRLRDTLLIKKDAKLPSKFKVKPVLTKERFCQFQEYESDCKKQISLNPSARLPTNRQAASNNIGGSLPTAKGILQAAPIRSQPIEQQQQQQQYQSEASSPFQRQGQFAATNQTPPPAFSGLGGNRNTAFRGSSSSIIEEPELENANQPNSRFQRARFQSFQQKNESYQGYGRNNNNNSAQSEGQGFYRNKFMNRNNSSQGNMGDDDTNSQTAGTFVTASEQAQQNAQLKRQRQEGFFNKESGRYGRNSGNIELEGVGASRQGNQNQNKYGGGGVDSVVNMVHYHTLGRNINMNNSVPQQEVQQQASLCDGGYEDESKPKGQISKKFKPPGAPGSSQSTNQRNGNAQANEQLKGMDQKLVDLIESEIVENGTVIHWDDIAGLNSAKEAVHESIVWPMLNPKLFKGIRAPPKGLLLFGPPGTGKTMIGKAIACESKSTFFSISASSLTSKYIGEGEKMVKILFKLALVRQPSVIFIDEIDSLLCSRTENENEASRRIKTEFMVQMEGANTKTEERILMIGATNRPQELDDAVLRRFPKKLYIPLPNMVARKQLIKRVISNEEMEGTIFNLEEYDMDAIVNATKGYSGADMKNLCSEASLIPIRLCRGTNISNMSSTDIRPINKDDFLAAIRLVKATVSEKDLTGYLDWNSKFGSFEISETDINN